MRVRRSLFAILIAVVGVASLASAPVAAAQPRDDGVDVPVTLVTATDQHVDGTLHLRRFSARNGEVVAVGALSADLPGIGHVGDEPVRVTVQRVHASCDLFRLVLGPVDVDAADASDADTLVPVAIRELRMEMTADDGDRFTRLLLCGIGNVLGDSGTEVNARDLPLSEDQLARLLNRAIRLFR